MRGGELDESPTTNLVDAGLVKWHDQQRRSCLAQISDDVPGRVAEYGDFSVGKRTLEQSFTRLGSGAYIVTNTTNLFVVCNGTRWPTVEKSSN
jgi:hypothetical protein